MPNLPPCFHRPSITLCAFWEKFGIRQQQVKMYLSTSLKRKTKTKYLPSDSIRDFLCFCENMYSLVKRGIEKINKSSRVLE